MSYSPGTVANFFLDRASQEGRAITPMQLLKLVYIAHGWHLGYYGSPLINEQVQAWRHGPVIHSLYKQLKQYGSGAVSAPVSTGAFPWARESISPQAEQLLESVWKNYSGFSGVQLSNMTHMEDTPWSIAWHQQGGKSMYFAPITDDLIEAHYKRRITHWREAAEAETAQAG